MSNGGSDPGGGARSGDSGLSAEQLKQRAALSRQMTMSVGAIMTVLMQSKIHRDLRLADIESFVAPAVATGQFSLAEATLRHNGLIAPVAAVLWACVSDAVDQRIMTRPGQPLGLTPPEWHSGDAVWIVEAVGEQKVLSELIERLKAGVWKGRTVKMRAQREDGVVGVHFVMQKPSV